MTIASENYTRERPYVSVIIPARNEEKYIDNCLRSLLDGTYPSDRMEVLLIDGMSEDKTRAIVSMIESASVIKIIDNPKRGKPTGLNLGIEHANGEYVVRADAHTVYAPNYVEQCISLIESSGAVNVGGAQTPEGKGYFAKTVASVLRTKFAAGSSYWERSEITEVDTVYLGTWNTQTLREIGGFSEEWVVNQDFELNARLRRAGGKILFSPLIKCVYMVRPTPLSLSLQFFRYGKYRVKTMHAYPETFNIRHVIPVSLVLSLFVGFLLLPVSWLPITLVSVPYIVGVLLASLSLTRQSDAKVSQAVAATIVFPIIHLSWGIGLLVGLIRFGTPKLRKAHIQRALINTFIRGRGRTK